MTVPDSILLVDDEEGIRTVLEIELADAGYRVFTAENGKQGLEIFKREQPPIVLTDIKMPGMDGLELLRKIKHENPEAEVIMITGHGDMELAIESLKREATDFITKPISGYALEVALRRARGRILMRQKLKEYTENLERLVQEKSQLQDRLSSLGLRISSISHGIKGLLTGLDGGLYLVDSGLGKADLEQTQEGWRTVKRMIERIRQMVMDILFYARERELALELVDAREFGLDVTRVMAPKIEAQQIGFHYRPDPDIGTLQIDPGFIRTALINILENAVDACIKDAAKPTHQIVFRLAGETGHVRFEIEDNGIGMNRETREKIFDLFFSSKGSTGTGLGLFIADKVVGQHNGTISAESEPGKGTRFTVRLPRSRTVETEGG